MSTQAWDDLVKAIDTLAAQAATGRSELALRPVFAALKAVAESEGTGSAYRQPSIEKSDED